MSVAFQRNIDAFVNGIKTDTTPESLAWGIGTCSMNPGMPGALGMRGRKKIDRLFLWGPIVQRLTETYAGFRHDPVFSIVPRWFGRETPGCRERGICPRPMSGVSSRTGGHGNADIPEREIQNTGRQDYEDYRGADRRRRLPGTQRGDPGRCPAGFMHDFETIGIRNGWLGLIEGDVEPLTDFSVSGILPKGGTILGTSRTNPLAKTADFQKIQHNLKKYGIHALIVIGGDGTLSAARDVAGHGIPLVGVPKTIDNDICETDVTFGFDTAVATVTEAIDRLHTTAESHHRIIVVEVMGRDVGLDRPYRRDCRRG